MLQQVPLGRGTAFVEGQGVAQHPGGKRHVRLGLADAGVRAHGGPDEKAVRRVRDQGLVGGGIVGRVDEPDPGIELCGPDEFGVVEIDVADDQDFPGTFAAHGGGAVLGASARARCVGMPDHVRLVGTQEDERAGDQGVALADGHGAAGDGTPAVHAVDCDLEGCLGRRAAGEDGVDGLDGLSLLAGQSRHDGLRKELPAEDDAMGGAQALSPVAVGADLFEGQCVDERSDGGHQVSILLWGWGAHHCGISGPDGARNGRRGSLQPFLTATSKSDTLPRRGFPGTRPRHSVS